MLHPDASGMKHGTRSTPENYLGFVYEHRRLRFAPLSVAPQATHSAGATHSESSSRACFGAST